MGKPSRRPGRADRDVHAAIREQADALKRAPSPGVRDAATLPDVAALLAASRCAVEASVPSAVVFAGRRYYLRVRLGIVLDVFDAPGAAEPLIRGATFSDEALGHAPGH